jgi:hypothetical protein
MRTTRAQAGLCFAVVAILGCSAPPPTRCATEAARAGLESCATTYQQQLKHARSDGCGVSIEVASGTCGRYTTVRTTWGEDTSDCYYDPDTGARLAYWHCTDTNSLCGHSVCESAGEAVDPECDRGLTHSELICPRDGGVRPGSDGG